MFTYTIKECKKNSDGKMDEVSAGFLPAIEKMSTNGTAAVSTNNVNTTTTTTTTNIDKEKQGRCANLLKQNKKILSYSHQAIESSKSLA